MANGGQRRTRSERVAALELPPGHWERAWLGLCHRDVLSRMALAFVAAVAVCVIIQAWDPPIALADGHGAHALRDVAGGVQAGKQERDRTGAAEGPRRNQGRFHAGQEPLEQLRAKLRTTIAELTKTETLTAQTAGSMEGIPAARWKKGRPRPSRQAELAAFQEFRKALAGKDNLDQLDHAVAEAFAPLEAARLAGEPDGKAQGLQPEDDRGLPGRESRGAARCRSQRSDRRSRRRSARSWPRDSARRRLPTGSTPGSSRGCCTPPSR